MLQHMAPGAEHPMHRFDDTVARPSQDTVTHPVERRFNPYVENGGYDRIISIRNDNRVLSVVECLS